MQVLNPITYPNWDNLIKEFPGHSIFHTSAWAKVLYECYGYEPVYFAEMNGESPTGIIPVMEVKSKLTGDRGVSLPFTDFCNVLSTDRDDLIDIYRDILRYGRLKGWKYVEFRDDISWKERPVLSALYLVHVLGLDAGEKSVFRSFRSSTRRNIKKAQKEGVRIEIRHDQEAVDIYYRLHTLTRKRQGLPPQPRLFFRKIHEHIISENRGFVVLAKYGEKYVAGAVYFHFGDKAIYKYGASDKTYQHLRANNLVMWEAIKWYIQNGFKSFHFGRTSENNKGLIQFKKGWGTEEAVLKYHKFDFKKSVFANSDAGDEPSYSIFRYLPEYLCQLAGTLAYKHFG